MIRKSKSLTAVSYCLPPELELVPPARVPSANQQKDQGQIRKGSRPRFGVADKKAGGKTGLAPLGQSQILEGG